MTTRRAALQQLLPVGHNEPVSDDRSRSRRVGVAGSAVASRNPRHGRTAWASRATVAVAWIGTLALSRLLEVVLVDAMGVDASLMTWIWLVVAVLLVVLAGLWGPARPLRGYFVVMLAVIVAGFLVWPFLSGLGAVQAGSDMLHNLKEKMVLAAVGIGMGAFLVVILRQRPNDVFLTLGNLRARSTVHLPGRSRPLSWAVLGPIATIALCASCAGLMWLGGAFSGQGFDPLMGLAPLMVATAVCNAVGEEILYRAGPLAFLSRVVGTTQAIMMTSVWFGLGHYSGSGIAGPVLAVGAGVVGVVVGRAMVATGGLGWPLIIHTAVDLMIFSAIAMAGT